MRNLLSAFFILSFLQSTAQPVLDVANIKYTGSPDAGLFRRSKQPAEFDNLSFGLNLPLIFKKDSSALVFSPFAELWHLKINDMPWLPDQFQAFAFQVSYIKPVSKKWTLALSIIPRWNGYNGHWFDHNFQMGGAVLATYKITNSLKYKFGVYYNNEFSGPFFMPLLGIDWRINTKNNVYGVLPGNLVWEHKINRRIYYGAVFRAITNSYRAGFINNKNYFLRIDDNQLTAYSDLYLTKNIVFSLEAGHSVLRRFRFGYKDGPEKYFFTTKINDNLVIKAGLAYRMRL